MTRPHEELDEVIDRVAASMTFAPADSTLAARVAESIHGEARAPFPWLRVVAAAAAMAIVVAAVTMSRNEPAEHVVTTAVSGVERVAPPSGAEQPDRAHSADLQASAAAAAPQVHQRTRAGAPIHRGAVPQIAALLSPDPLDVDELETQSLTIAPVELPPLDLTSLAIAEIDSRDDYRE